MAKSPVINKDAPANVYLFYGEEAYKKRNYKEQLKAAVAGPGSMNYAAFEGRDIDFSAVYDNVVTLPFFAEKRLVIVENSGKFKAAKKEAADSTPENASDEASDNAQETGRKKKNSDKAENMLEKILNDLPETTVLAFFESEINKTKKVYKTIAAKGVVCECSPDDRDTVVKWLARGFAASNKKIRKSTAELIVDRAGTDYYKLRTEVEKIVSYAADSDEITDKDVLAVTSEDIESKIFDMLEAMCNKNPRKVMEYYYGLTANREHPLYILAMIRIQFRTLLQTAELYADGYSKYEIASRLKKRDFVIERSIRYLKYFKTARLIEILDIISDVDKRIKTGDIDEQVGVETMLVEFSA